MPRRIPPASNLALIHFAALILVFASVAGPAAAQPANPDAIEGESPASPPEAPPEAAAPTDGASPDEPPPPTNEAPPEPPDAAASPPSTGEPTAPTPEPTPPTRTTPPPSTPPTAATPTAPPPTRAPTPPPTQAPTRTAPPPSAPPASAPAASAPAAPPAAAPAPEAKPAKESVRESTRRRTDADKKQRFRHGGFILDAKVGGGGCMRTTCQGTAGHHAAPGLHLGGFLGFNLFGLIELGLEGGWSGLRPRDVAGRNALALYGLDPAQLQQAILADQTLPFPVLDFSSFNVTSAKSRAFDIGPSLRIHLIRKGRGLLFVGAGVHYQLWRNDYVTQGGNLRVDSHGASLPLRVGAGVFLTRNIALMGEVAYAPAIFGGMSFRLGDDRGVVPLKILEDTTGINVSKNLPHFWSFALTLRFRL